jgi:hypothetical protein
LTGRRDGGLRVTLTRILVAVLGSIVLLGGVATLLQARTERVLEGALLEDEPVGGMTHDELTAIASRQAADADEARFVVEGVRERVEATRTEVGIRHDPGAATTRVWSLGRRDPVRTLWDHGRVLLGRSIAVRLPQERDDDAFADWTAGAAEALSVEPRAAGVELTPEPAEPDDPGSRARPIEPLRGEEVTADDLAERLADQLGRTRRPVTLASPGEVREPPADQRDLDATLPDARTAVSAPVVLENPAGGADLPLGEAELAGILEVRLEADEDPGRRLRLVADPGRLVEVAGEQQVTATEVQPQDASFTIVEGTPEIEGGTPGYVFDADAVAAQLPSAAVQEPEGDGTPRTAELEGERPEPEFTRSDAEELGIQERISSFTTNYACCPPRVTNIQRAAAIISGSIVRSGETFSLDEALGPRTRARGFVAGGVIIDGEFEEALGGGISQFATTFFNAAFFAGIRVHEHQPHSYYISRYPMGRESTISRGVIDVVIENDSPYGILITASAGTNSVTVSFWSSPWAEVEAWSSGPFNYRSGAVRDGFSIRYGRTITYPDGSTHEDEWSHRYQPQNN